MDTRSNAYLITTSAPAPTGDYELVQTTDIENGPDLVMTSVNVPTGAAIGGQTIVPNTVKNQGNTAADGFYVSYYLSQTQYTTNLIYLGSRYIPSNDYFGIFGAGATKSDNTIITIPPDIVAGEYYFVVVADGYNTVAEIDEINNYFYSSFMMNIQNSPDLIITSVTAPSTGLRGRTITVNNSVKNQGNLATGGFYITYYLTPYQNLNTKTWIGNRYIKSLAAGASNTANTILTIPSTIAKGQYYIAAKADSSNQITEANEDNDVFSTVKMDIKDGRDLLITKLTTVSAIGRTITVNNSVKNQGNLATGGFYITYYLTPYQNLNTKTWIGNRYIKSLAAGASNTANTILTIPSTIAKGQYYIAAKADSSNQITEANEDNNKGYSTSKIVIAIDKIAPIIKKTVPANNSKGVSLTSQITITFSENIRPSTNFARIYIKNLTTGKKVIISSKTINGKTLTLKMKYNRIKNDLYQVYIPASAVKDYSGNKLKNSYSFKFRSRK